MRHSLRLEQKRTREATHACDEITEQNDSPGQKSTASQATYDTRVSVKRQRAVPSQGIQKHKSLGSSAAEESVGRVSTIRANFLGKAAVECVETVALAATHWLIEETRRAAPGAKGANSGSRAAACLAGVAEMLRELGKRARSNDVRSTLVAAQPDCLLSLAWCERKPCEAAALDKARENYAAWDPPMTPYEWFVERRTLEFVRDALARAAAQTSSLPDS